MQSVKDTAKEIKNKKVSDYLPKKKPKIKPIAVKITGIDIPFWDMVNFMVMAAVAAIPAIIILFLIGMVLIAILGGLGGIAGR